MDKIRRVFYRIVFEILKASGKVHVTYHPALVISAHGNSKSKKRALLAYVPQPILGKMYGDRFNNFSNPGIALAFFKVLKQLGYWVDVINWDDTTWRPEHNYDLIIAHGGKNTETLLKLRQAGAKIIYFASGSYWKYHNDEAAKRAAYFAERHPGHKLMPDRPVEVPEEAILEASNGIICLGSESARNSYSKFPHTYAIENGTYPNHNFNPNHKNFLKARNNFLFYAGGGNLHKGLDLLLDAFVGMEQHLYICTSLVANFEKFYHKQLFETPNIHYLGVVGIHSKEFYDAASACAYAILPSCAEGGAGSVGDCMQQGLIPVVTPATVVNIGDFGFSIDDIHVQALKEQITNLAKLAPTELSVRSKQAHRHSSTEQSPVAFERKLKAIISTIQVS